MTGCSKYAAGDGFTDFFCSDEKMSLCVSIYKKETVSTQAMDAVSKNAESYVMRRIA